jgi:hypothetical protein
MDTRRCRSCARRNVERGLGEREELRQVRHGSRAYPKPVTTIAAFAAGHQRRRAGGRSPSAVDSRPVPDPIETAPHRTRNVRRGVGLLVGCSPLVLLAV